MKLQRLDKMIFSNHGLSFYCLEWLWIALFHVLLQKPYALACYTSVQNNILILEEKYPLPKKQLLIALLKAYYFNISRKKTSLVSIDPGFNVHNHIVYLWKVIILIFNGLLYFEQLFAKYESL